MVMRNLIAVVPARGGSKRIPRKNLIEFFGRPMIAWTIDAARQTGLFDRIIVSTDDEEIAATGQQWGAEVPFRRQGHADDHAPVAAATIVAVEQARAHFDENYRTVVQLMPNCPLRGAAEIYKAVEAFWARDPVFQISCFTLSWMNPWWAAELDQSGHPKYLFKGRIQMRSQDLPRLYCPTGAIWVANARRLREVGTFYGPGHVFEPLEWRAAIDIDDEHDLAMAKALFAANQTL